MFDNPSAKQTLKVDTNINEASSLFQQALKNIGSHKDTDFQSANTIILKGKSRYGLQGIPLFIRLNKIDEGTTDVTIAGNSDDIRGIGAKKCIERLIAAFNTLKRNDPNEVEALTNTPSFQRKTGFTKKKLLMLVGGFVLLLIIIMNANKGGGSGGSGSVRQSPFDNSVDCVEYYLKHKYLKDPDSYEGISWTKVQQNSDGTYSVSHTFRAKNGFGGMGVETHTFTIASDGWTVTNVY